MKTVFKVRYERGAAGTMLIYAETLEGAQQKMYAYFKRTHGFERCVLLSVEYLGPLWEDV